jgi:hypothetical protein
MEQVQGRANHRDLEGAGGRHGDGRYVPPTRRQLGDVLQVEVEIRGLEVSEAWRLRALEEENARPENAVVRRNRDSAG